MNNKSYQTFIDIQNILLNFISAYVFISGFIIIAVKDYTLALYALPLVSVPLFSYILYQLTNHKWSFLLSHLIMLTVYALLIKNSLLRGITVIYILAVAICTLVSQYESGHNASLIFAAVSFLFAIYCSYYIEKFEFTTFYFSLTVIYVLLFLWNMYLINYSKYFMTYENIQNLPVQRMKKTNNRMILIFVIFCLLMMCVFSLIPVGDILSYIGRLLRQFMNYLNQFFPKLSLNQYDVSTPDTPDKVPNHKLPQGEPNNLLYLFLRSLVIILRYLLIAGILIFIIVKIVKLIKRYHKNGNGTIEKVPDYPAEKRENLRIRPVKVNVKKIAELFFPSNNKKIRKYYCETVSHSRSAKKISKDMTPTRLSPIAIQTSDIQQANLLTGYYEKARYSSSECTNEEVQSVKDLIK